MNNSCYKHLLMEKGKTHQQNCFSFFTYLLFDSKQAARLQRCQIDLAHPNTEPVLGDQLNWEATTLFVSDLCIFGMVCFCSLVCKIHQQDERLLETQGGRHNFPMHGMSRMRGVVVRGTWTDCKHKMHRALKWPHCVFQLTKSFKDHTWNVTWCLSTLCSGPCATVCHFSTA